MSVLDTSSWDKSILFFVNGKKIVIDDSKAVDQTLLSFLRSRGMGLTGTKLGCGEGGCGACSVMISRYDHSTEKVDHRAVNACLALLPSLDGAHIVTIEGLGNIKSPHVVQRRIAEYHGSQCGFCTPGIVMALYAFLRNNPHATQADIEESFDGNLCRCTGYRPILDAAKTFGSDYEPLKKGEEGEKNGLIPNDVQNGLLQNGLLAQTTSASSNDLHNHVTAPTPRKPGICPGTGLPCRCDRVEDVVDGGFKIEFPDSPCDPIFPPFLKTYRPKSLVLSYQPKSTTPPTAGESHSADGSITPSPNTAAANACTWYRPTTLKELVKLKSQFPEARISVGTTEVTIEMNLKRTKYPYSHFISPMSIPELASDFKVVDDGVIIGAAVSLSVVTERCKSLLKEIPEWKGRAILAVVEQLRWFAGTQIRNVACLGGNIATASPISDINPVLLASGATLTIQSISNQSTDEIEQRQITMSRDFFTGYRITALQKSDVIINIKIPFTREHEYILAFKQARRKDDDIAIASGSFRINFSHHPPPPSSSSSSSSDPSSSSSLDPKNSSHHHFLIESATLAYGGMAPFTKCASKNIENFMIGKKITEISDGIFGMLESEFTLAPHAPGGMVDFRRSLVLSFFYKYMLYVQDQLSREAEEFFSPQLRSAFEPYHRPVSSGTQVWEGAHKIDIGPVGKSEVHVSALKQVTGEAQYVDDIPSDGALFAAYVFSEEAHANILSIDASAALAHEGVVAYFDSKDIPGDNDCGAVVHDEEVFASKKVLCVGYPIGIVVAKTQKLAQQGAKLVKVTYQPLPSILTIAEAIAAESYYPTRNELLGGKMDESTWSACDHIEEGTFTMGGQEHFYLECQTTLAVPGEGDEMMIWSSTQNPTKTQYKVASVLGVPSNKVVTKLKRLGGGFGGKETRSVFVSCAAAVAAYKLRAPVRISLDRDEDMASTGTRHPYYAKYKVGFSKEGKLIALDVAMFSNAGCTQDLSINVGERSLLSLLSAYQCPNVHASVNVCRTNWPSSTAFRGFGAPQSMILMEVIMDRIVSVVKRPHNQVRFLNLSKDGDSTFYGQKMPICNGPRVWSHLMERVNFEEREAQVMKFNSENRHVKRGISCMPTQFGLSFTFKPMNQAGALVHIYTDGSALVSTGGVEMGQGLNTKMIQIASQALNIPLDKVHISETSTDKVPNTMPSAASVSADLNGMAVLDACNTLMARLSPFLSKTITSEDGKSTKTIQRTMGEAAMAAHMERVSLSATGFYATPLEGFDWVQRKGTPFAYFTWGAACSEVQIDCLTGDHTVIRTDLVMDVGQSINPAIDIGQIEGGFAQGYGLTVLEELVTDDRHTRTPGRIFTRGPSTYKIPAFKDIPLQLNVHLLPHSENPGTIHSSKGVGEPPLHLGASVYFALKRAVAAARGDSNLHTDFDFDSPATCERIRMACLDQFTSLITKTPLPLP
jgi:xanthine dehydrogenase/oxidase